MSESPLVVAITGGSGVIYSVRLLQVLIAAGRKVFVTASPSGVDVVRQELGFSLDLSPAGFDIEKLVTAKPAWSEREVELPNDWPSHVTYAHYQDYFSPIASGSFLTDGMIVCPCSGSTLSAIGRAASGNLIHRAAEVALKERRKLVLVTRETPLSEIAIENMHRAARAGATLLPAMPGWYHGVTCLDDLVDFIVGRVLDQFGVDNSLMQRWGEA